MEYLEALEKTENQKGGMILFFFYKWDERLTPILAQYDKISVEF